MVSKAAATAAGRQRVAGRQAGGAGGTRSARARTHRQNQLKGVWRAVAQQLKGFHAVAGTGDCRNRAGRANAGRGGGGGEHSRLLCPPKRPPPHVTTSGGLRHIAPPKPGLQTLQLANGTTRGRPGGGAEQTGEKPAWEGQQPPAAIPPTPSPVLTSVATLVQQVGHHGASEARIVHEEHVHTGSGRRRHQSLGYHGAVWPVHGIVHYQRVPQFPGTTHVLTVGLAAAVRRGLQAPPLH